MPDDNQWKEHSSLECSFFPFLSPLINSSMGELEEIVSDNSNVDIESFSPSPIPNKDSDSHMEEIDLPFTPDDPMPSGIEDDDYEYGRDILILEELLDNYSLSLHENESYHFDIPSSYRPPANPPDGNTGTLNIKMMGEISDQKLSRIHGNMKTLAKGFLYSSLHFLFINLESLPTPMVEQAKLKLDLVEKSVDHIDYRSMIGSLMYVTSSRPDIMFTTCMCARYQANPNEHHVSAVKRIFRYLKGTINLGLWYPKDSGFDLTAYLDADHAGCHLDRKSTSGSVQFLGDKL
nr:hypothetical protein [Tanacetum cinerariifolium]